MWGWHVSRLFAAPGTGYYTAYPAGDNPPFTGHAAA